MTDKELLELAAKAAAIKAKWFTVKLWTKRKGFGDTRFGCGTKQVFGTHHAKPWNPLTDDGDALRLSVKLSIHIEHAGQSGKKADRVQASPRGHGHLAWVEMYEGNPHAATRRAIVRAAAEIGKAM